MSLLEHLNSTSGFLKVRRLVDKEVIDNLAFRCHYRITSLILIACCILCTANSLIGKPIECLSDHTFKGSEAVVNSYCWISSTFTIPEYRDKKKGVGTVIIADGVGPYQEGHGKEYHSYYQWVPFVLFLQAIMFYAPHWLWKNWEGGRIRRITEGVRGSTIATSESKQKRHSALVTHVLESIHQNNTYAFYYVLCEALNFVNVVGNIYFVDKFLGNTFLTYGTKVLDYAGMDQEDRTDPMIAIFPRITKCLFHTFGVGGSVQVHDLLCILPLNILNEKIYIFLWFWFIILSAISGLALIYSIMIVAYSPIRKSILEKRYKYKTPGNINTILSKTKIGDFLLLHLIGRNLCNMTFHELLNELSTELADYKTN